MDRAPLLVLALGLATALSGCLQLGADDGSTAEDAYVVEGTEWQLAPADLTVAAGEEVTVTFENHGEAAHNWALDLDGDGEPEHVTETIQPGEQAETSFTVDEPGEHAYFCNVSGHRDAGMEGTLTVAG